MPSSSSPILFIFKAFYVYQQEEQPIVPPLLSTGLKTSAQLVVDMLNANGIHAILAEAKDQNGIQALVTQYAPKRVILEAIWVTQQKMHELVDANPDVMWAVRVHSQIPFLANEGMAIAWLVAYAKLGVDIAFNAEQAVRDFRVIGRSDYLPNYYPPRQLRDSPPASEVVNVGCFGSIRPLKNQLIQAFAALSYAASRNRRLAFHMNGTRLEQSGANNLKNIKALFEEAGETLVLHPWLNHEAFLRLVASMDICLQVSMTESFCIVAADAASQGVPLVGSHAIGWLPHESKAETDSVSDIVYVMDRMGGHAVRRNTKALLAFCKTSVSAWKAWAEYGDTE